MGAKFDFEKWVPAAVAEQCEQYTGKNIAVDWIDVQANITHVLDQYLLHAEISENEIKRALEIYNQEVLKLDGPIVAWESVWGK